MKALRFGAGFCILLPVLLLLDSAASDENDNYRVPPNFAPALQPVQPVPFSHARHAGTLNLPCGTCHAGANNSGDDMTLPDSSLCMSCHRVVAIDNPAIQQLAEYDRTGSAIGWVRVYKLLDGVNWTHRPHLDASIDCRSCHGDVAQLELMSMTTAITAMSSCINCHRAHAANSQCETCHTWPSSEQLRRWKGE